MIPYLVRPGRVAALMELVSEWPAVVFDAETSSLDLYLDAKLLGIGIGSLHDSEDACYYIPFAHEGAANVSLEEGRQLAAVINGKAVLGYKLKFDLHAAIDVLGELPESPLYDVLVLARIMSKGMHPALDLETVARQVADLRHSDEKVAGGRKDYGKGKFTVEEIGRKCCEDVHFTRMVYRSYRELLPDTLRKLFGWECRLTRRLFQMERRGVLYDPDEVEKLDQRLGGAKKSVLAWLRDNTGLPDFNPGSNPQMSALMEKLGIRPRARSGKTGQPSWGREVLMELAGEGNELALKIAQYRALGHEQSNFVAVLKKHVVCGQPVLRSSYQNWGTETGRLSSQGPNVQAIAKGWLQLGQMGEGGDSFEPLHWEQDSAFLETLPEELRISLRQMFKPREGFEFMEADYRQIEMFVAGFYMKDPAFMALLQSEDFHAATALWVWGSDAKEFRNRAKWFNFGLMYGLGLDGLAKKLGCTIEEAKLYREQYFARLGPGYFRVMRIVKRLLANQDYVENVFGRRYYVPVEQAYIAWNYLCQGSAGDFVKFRQIPLEPVCAELGAFPFFTTHDDVTFEIPLELGRQVGPIVDVLEDGGVFGLHLPVKLAFGRENLAFMEEVDIRVSTA